MDTCTVYRGKRFETLQIYLSTNTTQTAVDEGIVHAENPCNEHAYSIDLMNMQKTMNMQQTCRSTEDVTNLLSRVLTVCDMKMTSQSLSALKC